MIEQLDAKHASYSAMVEQWELLDHAQEGEHAIKAQGTRYLPKTPGMVAYETYAAYTENQDNRHAMEHGALTRYENYKLRAEFPEKLAPAVNTSAGLFTEKPAAYELPPAWEGIAENCTLEADSLADLHKRVSLEVAAKGRCGLWVDVRQDGVTPYFVLYDAAQIINWREVTVGDERILQRLVLLTCDDIDGAPHDRLTIAELADGKLLVRRFIRRKNTFGEWQEDLDTPQPRAVKGAAENAILGERNAVTGFALDRIPFQFINADHLKPDIGRAPFLALAKQCLKVYRMDANYQEALSFYEPTPFISGMTEEWINQGLAPKTMGAGVVWYGPENSDAKMLEYTGPSIENQRKAIDEALTRADELSMRPFEPRHNGAESGEAKDRRAKAQTSAAKLMAQNVADGIERALRIAARWLGAPLESVSFRGHYDFMQATMSPAEAATLYGLHEGGGISRDTYHENLQRGGLTNRTAEEEFELIDQGL